VKTKTKPFQNMSDIIKKEGEIALGLEKLDAYLTAIKEWQKKLFQQLDNYDYREPYEGADMKILTFSGARKLGKILRVNVEIKSEEFIMKGDEIWGVKVVLRTTLPNGDSVETIGYCGYDEKSMLTRDGKKPVSRLQSIAYKRAFVQAIRIHLGLPDFAEETIGDVAQDEEVEKEEVKNEVKRYDISDKQLIFLVDLFIKRHLTKELAFKIINRLIELAKSGQLTSQSVSSAIDYLTKYKKPDNWKVSWGDMEEGEIFATKFGLVEEFLNLIGKSDLVKQLKMDLKGEDEIPF